MKLTCDVCGWTPPKNIDSTLEDQIAAHQINEGH